MQLMMTKTKTTKTYFSSSSFLSLHFFGIGDITLHPTIPYLSHVVCPVSHVMCHVSHVMCHVSHVTCHMSPKERKKKYTKKYI